VLQLCQVSADYIDSAIMDIDCVDGVDRTDCYAEKVVTSCDKFLQTESVIGSIHTRANQTLTLRKVNIMTRIASQRGANPQRGFTR
jgi:hypothetical protein